MIDSEKIFNHALIGESYFYQLENGFKLELKPKSLREIFNTGWEKYQLFNASILFSKERYLEARKQEENYLELENIFNKLSSFKTMLVIMGLNEEFAKDTKDAYSFFLGGMVEFDSEKSKMILGLPEKIIEINEKDFNNIGEILKIQNKLIDIEDKKDEPKYDMTREGVRKLLEKQRIAREKLARAKNKDAQSLDFRKMISIMATIKTCFISDILDKMYLLEFHQQFDLYNKKAQYELGIQRLMAGDKPENVKLEHWFY